MLSVIRLPNYCRAKCFWAFSPIAVGLVVVVASLFIEPASSFAGRRARRATNKPVASATTAESSAAKTGRPAKIGQHNPQDETVELFEAMEAGQIAVKLIPKDSTEGRVFIKNKTDKPLNVRLPDAFAATQVLGQMGMGGMGMGGGGGGGQGMGGGMGGMGGGGGGMFNVPADKEGKFLVPCVCLEHGKAEPRPQMAYAVKPIESFTTKPGVAEMLKDLGHNKIDQRAAQVAAWHLNNGMSWEALATKKIERIDGSSYPYFSPEELRGGMFIAESAVAAAAATKQDTKKPSPGETAAKGG